MSTPPDRFQQAASLRTATDRPQNEFKLIVRKKVKGTLRVRKNARRINQK